MSTNRSKNIPVDMKLCRKCKKILNNHNIKSSKDFRKWSLKNHPDKGGDEEIFKIVSTCYSEYFGNNNSCYMDYNYSKNTNNN